MRGRRRETRYLAAPQWEGALQTLEDVVTERVSDGEIWVLSAKPARGAQAFTLEIATTEGTVTMKVRVTKCEPVLIANELRHRLRLHVIGAAEQAHQPKDNGTSAQETTE